MAKKNSIITVTPNEAGTEITFTVEGAGTIAFNVAALSEEIRTRAMIHGLVQKISDGAAIPKADLSDDPAIAAGQKFSAMTAIADRLSAGDWSKRSGDGSGPVAGVIYRAFRLYVEETAKAKKAAVPSEEQTRAVYDSRDRAGQLALRSIPRIAEIIETLKATSPASSKIDAAALLDELGL